MSSLPAPCSWSSFRGRPALCTAESVWAGRQPGAQRTLRTVRVQSRRIRQAALSLQRKPHCSSSSSSSQAGGEETWKTSREAGKNLLRSVGADSAPGTALLLPCNFSPTVVSVGWVPPLPPPPLPHLPPHPFYSFSPHQPRSLLLPPDSERVCRVRHFLWRSEKSSAMQFKGMWVRVPDTSSSSQTEHVLSVSLSKCNIWPIVFLFISQGQ